MTDWPLVAVNRESEMRQEFTGYSRFRRAAQTLRDDSQKLLAESSTSTAPALPVLLPAP